MRTIRTKLYKFSELSKESQEKAIENLSSINVDYEWWEFTFEDAKNVGLEITEFYIDRGCKGLFIDSAVDTANKIIEQHGAACETYKTAKTFLEEYEEEKAKFEEEYEDEYFLSDEDELAEDFLKSLLEDYRIMLRNEYEYLTSEKAIKETIEANDYEFTREGKRF
jgi:hypothetical protein